MHVVGELHCIYCGYVAGEIDGDRDRSLAAARLTPARNGPGFIYRRGDRPRCGRCGGGLVVECVNDIFRRSPPAPAGAVPSRRNEQDPMGPIPVRSDRASVTPVGI